MPKTIDLSQRQALSELINAVTGEVRLGLHDRLLYATDASIYQQEPIAVVIPDSIDDACRAVEACHRLGLPVLLRGGGTSLAGQCVSEGVVIDLSPRCTSVTELDIEARTCIAECGVPIADLNATIAHSGLFFAPDPSTVRQATVGGCIGNNAAGAHSVLFGRTSENVESIEVCLANGDRAWFGPGTSTQSPLVRSITERVIDTVTRHREQIRARFPKTLRRSAGYQLDVVLDQLEAGADPADTINLAPLLCGSEGTLALTLRAKLKLHPLPKATGLAVIAFSDLDEAIESVVPLLKTDPSAIELLDDLILELALNNPEQRKHVALLPHPVSGELRAVLYVEYFADDAKSLNHRLHALAEMFPIGNLVSYTDRNLIQQAWALRVAGEPLLHGIPGDRKPVGFVEDNAVPPERLAEFVHEFRRIVTEEGTTASYYAHASVGVLHVRPLLNLKDHADRERMQRIATRVAELARSMGGVMSGEHGDGKARGPLLEPHFGPELMSAFGEVKSAFDPDNRMNPGNIVSPGDLHSITQQLRVRPKEQSLRVPDTKTLYTYDDQTDFEHAVERCNGAGVCRKRTGGVMCPSYQATLDERHSTRGRGNALRLAITGQSVTGPEASRWNDAETLATLDLCLSCKACKSECPSNVDIARLKGEYHAQRFASGVRVPLATRAIGSIASAQSFASLSPSLYNRLAQSRISRRLMRRFLEIDERRSLPQIKRSLRKRWGRPRPSESSAPRVLLLGDTFTNHNEPDIGLATRRVLQAFGYEVELCVVDDLTRAKISQGLLVEAIRSAEKTLRRLEPWLADPDLAGVVICEPSCLSAVTDDWASLRLKSPPERLERLIKLSSLPEQFLETHWTKHPKTPSFKKPSGRVVFHAHCHQKALGGADSSANMLRRAFGEVEVLDTTCCGLAGAFGFSTHRYDLSMKIGELGVLPAARELGAEDILLASGTSCRHQIRDGAGRTAIHPIELLDRQLSLEAE